MMMVNKRNMMKISEKRHESVMKRWAPKMERNNETIVETEPVNPWMSMMVLVQA